MIKLFVKGEKRKDAHISFSPNKTGEEEKTLAVEIWGEKFVLRFLEVDEDPSGRKKDRLQGKEVTAEHVMTNLEGEEIVTTKCLLYMHPRDE